MTFFLIMNFKFNFVCLVAKHSYLFIKFTIVCHLFAFLHFLKSHFEILDHFFANHHLNLLCYLQDFFVLVYHHLVVCHSLNYFIPKCYLSSKPFLQFFNFVNFADCFDHLKFIVSLQVIYCLKFITALLTNFIIDFFKNHCLNFVKNFSRIIHHDFLVNIFFILFQSLSVSSLRNLLTKFLLYHFMNSIDYQILNLLANLVTIHVIVLPLILLTALLIILLIHLIVLLLILHTAPLLLIILLHL